jgi:hypothetical protein
VTGTDVERARFADGSYAGRRPPGVDAAVHALLHGRGLFRYRPGLRQCALSFAALLVGVVLMPTALGLARLEHDREVSQLERTLVAETDEHGGALEEPGPLSAEEWAFMRRHTLIGERIIAAAPALAAAAGLVRASHESWNGTGSPDKLTGTDIPLGARIIAVCDAFDAMIADRPYSPPRTIEDALAELRRCAGTPQFDPAIVPVFEPVLTDRARTPV